MFAQFKNFTRKSLSKNGLAITQVDESKIGYFVADSYAEFSESKAQHVHRVACHSDESARGGVDHQ
jgi:hypothetical protein